MNILVFVCRYGPIDDTPQLFNDTTLLFNLKGSHSIVGRSIIVEHSGGMYKNYMYSELIMLSLFFCKKGTGLVHFFLQLLSL